MGTFREEMSDYLKRYIYAVNSAVDKVIDNAVIDSAVDNAEDNVEDKNELLDKLIFENADNSELIKLLGEADKAVSVLENLVKVLKQKLYKEILKQKLYEEIKENNINLKEG